MPYTTFHVSFLVRHADHRLRTRRRVGRVGELHHVGLAVLVGVLDQRVRPGGDHWTSIGMRRSSSHGTSELVVVSVKTQNPQRPARRHLYHRPRQEIEEKLLANQTPNQASHVLMISGRRPSAYTTSVERFVTGLRMPVRHASRPRRLASISGPTRASGPRSAGCNGRRPYRTWRPVCLALPPLQ